MARPFFGTKFVGPRGLVVVIALVGVAYLVWLGADASRRFSAPWQPDVELASGPTTPLSGSTTCDDFNWENLADQAWLVGRLIRETNTVDGRKLAIIESDVHVCVGEAAAPPCSMPDRPMIEIVGECVARLSR